jgi:DNA polymerase
MGESLEDVYDAYREDPAFADLRTTGIVLVPGDGHRAPNIMIVGEAPGATENTAVRPFVGASGRILRSLIEDVAELDSSEYFITNVVKYRPPGNRTPYPEEVDASIPYLRREWTALGCPSVLVAVGGTALSALAPSLSGITKLAGRPHDLPGARRLWPMIHPRWAINNPERQEALEQHWNQFRLWYNETGLH